VSASGDTVIVSLNLSPQPQKPSLGIAQAGLRGSQLRTLLSSPRTVADGSASDPPSLPPYAAWVAEVR
jgi:hypothetical protein